MQPVDICKSLLGVPKLAEVIDDLSSPQVKQVLKEGSLKVKLSSGFVSKTKKRAAWTKRILGAIEQENREVADELLRQWLLHHRREMLVTYLDLLAVKHTDGETDESFLLTCSSEAAREHAATLIERFDATEATAYLAYIAYQQRSNVFDDWSPITSRSQDAAGVDATR